MHSTPFVRTTRGFTLIELLVVIAIIGVLSSVVLASLSAARQKSRDAKRVAEVTQIGRALDLYYDAHQTYPSTTPSGYTGDDAGVQLLVAAGLLPSIPVPPLGTDVTYHYHGLYKDAAGVYHECDATAPAGTLCNSFEIGITLERSENPGLNNDADQQIGTFYGASASCSSNVAGDELCFDIKG
jgi:prepilin-type N-terminal cleavage/methylation domain-containing protein